MHNKNAILVYSKGKHIKLKKKKTKKKEKEMNYTSKGANQKWYKMHCFYIMYNYS